MGPLRLDSSRCSQWINFDRKVITGQDDSGVRQKRDQLDFLKTSYHLRPTRSTNPRDKVYGVLGLATDAKLVVPSPHYSLTMEEVYLKLLQSMTDVRGDLDWLTLAGNLGDQSDLPSWCPDLTRKSPRVTLNTSRSMQDGKNCGFFSQLKIQYPVVQFTSPPMTCTFSGFIVDTVDGLGPRQSAKDAAADTVPPRFQTVPTKHIRIFTMQSGLLSLQTRILKGHLTHGELPNRSDLSLGIILGLWKLQFKIRTRRALREYPVQIILEKLGSC